ncbi:GerMN domain-containing protein [Fuchsiella alkaliacetigena]|uniref:GerMN domain-containing protein n=1 Tax=Fuchsiella alkaliacetigena TaxID=957042 RepID=UPI002009E0AE|nr:GerMN domain-containing protein [Fuchsiella alkaliacetigena]MCK8824783.1 GerMN domain-containing protein [Fuchsiella alkaliacetigena]
MKGQRKYLFILIGFLLALGLIYLSLTLPVEESKVAEETKVVKLYFSYDQAQSLKVEEREIGTKDLYQNIIEELSKGPTQEELGATIPAETELLAWDLNGGELSLDFNAKFQTDHPGGSAGEIMTIYSIVNTMAQFEEVERVFFLVEGEKVETLVGHITLEEAVLPNYDLVVE